MSWQPLKDVMGEIKTRQEELNRYTGEHYYNIYEPGTTFLRYSITNFKLQLYNSLLEKYKNLNDFLPFCNIYILVEDSESSDSLKIFSTRDQVSVANQRLEGKATWFFEKKFDCGFASDLFAGANCDEEFASSTQPFWYRELAKKKEYKDLDKELKIYGIDKDKKKPSTLVMFALTHMELLLVPIDKSPASFEQTCTDLIKRGMQGNFIKKLNNNWKRIIYDQNCWYNIWVENKTKMNEQIFKLINKLIIERIEMYLNEENSSTDKFRNVEKELKKEIRYLVNELKVIDNYSSKSFGEPDYQTPYTQKNANLYHFPMLTPKQKDELDKFRGTCVNLCRDVTNITEVASHNMCHSVNMEKIALSWGATVDNINFRDDFPNLLKAIWLHYIGLTKYTSTNKILEFEGAFKYRTTYPYLGAEMLAELKDQLYLKNEEILILKTLFIYHSRIAPLTGKSEEIECGGTMKIVDPLEGIIHKLPPYPYFLTVTILRLIDSIDSQWDRCGQDIIGRLTKLVRETQTPTEELLHFFKHAYFDVALDDGYRKEVVYFADLHSPMFLILYAFAEVVSEIEKELKKVNQKGVIEKVREEWKTLTGNYSTDENLEIGFLKLRRKQFDVDVSLQGIPIDFSKEAWRELGDMSKKPTESVVDDETDNEPVGEFDVFIAYNSKDGEEVIALSKKLKKDGITLWYDKENICAGDIFPEEMEEAISRAKCGMIILGKNGLGKWQKKEYDLLYKRHVDAGISIIPVLLSGCSKNELSFLDLHDHVSFNNNIDENKAYDKLIKSIRKGIQRKQK